MILENYKSPKKKYIKRISDIISGIKTRGGIEFFNIFDKHISDATNDDIILDLLEGSEKKFILSSGGFGDRIYKMYKEKKFICKGLVIFNGGIATNNRSVDSYYPINFDINNKNFLYIDDSYYSGGTVNKIKDYLLKHNSTISDIVVVYDGSQKKDNGVYSFYKYDRKKDDNRINKL